MSTAMQQRPEQERPRSKSTFSFKSHKSHDSHGTKHDAHHLQQHQRQSSKDEHKPHFGPTTKADPNAAMNEVQPIATALEKPTLQSLRSFQHTDTNGNAIAEPDISNPTRSRWERPLDTIRSFEAAIDNEYKRRSFAMQGESPSDAMNGYNSRRSSFYSGGYEQNPRSYNSGGGYYGSRQSAMARESWGGDGYGGSPAPRNRYRMQQDSYRQNNGHGVYPTPGYQQSRDTVNTGGSGGSHSDPYTDPSSDNSSIERGGPVRQPENGELYGFSGFGGGPQPILEEYGNRRGPSNNNGYFNGQHHYTNSGNPPPVPAHYNQPAPPQNNPNVIKLSKTNSQGQGSPAVGGSRPNVLSRKSTEKSEKRGSWFQRRFSKK